jgi:ParB/RepB/Spo0J family partition protein
MSTRTISLDLIDPGSNDRKSFDPDKLAELAASLNEIGMITPPVVRPAGERFEIVCGERRTRAARLAGWTAMPCDVRELSDREASAMMLSENTGRDDLSAIDEAHAYAQRIAAFGLSNAEVASWAGVSTFRVTMRLRLLNTVPEAQHLLTIGQLPVSFAAAMGVLDANRQRFALNAWAESGGSLNQWAWTQLVNRLEGEQNAESMFDIDSFLQIEEYVLNARESQPSTKKLRRLLQDMVRACEKAGVAAEVTAEVRATWPRSWNVAAA